MDLDTNDINAVKFSGLLILFCTISGDDLDSCVLFRIIEILHSSYRDGHIKIADYLSVFITLVLRFKVSPGILQIFIWTTCCITFDIIHFLFHFSKSVLLSIILGSWDQKELAGVEIGNAKQHIPCDMAQK